MTFDATLRVPMMESLLVKRLAFWAGSESLELRGQLMPADRALSTPPVQARDFAESELLHAL